MARQVKGKATPGSTRTRKVSRGPNKGDTVKFKANSSSAQQPGKLKPRVIIKNVGPKNTASSLKTKAEHKKAMREK